MFVPLTEMILNLTFICFNWLKTPIRQPFAKMFENIDPVLPTTNMSINKLEVFLPGSLGYWKIHWQTKQWVDHRIFFPRSWEVNWPASVGSALSRCWTTWEDRVEIFYCCFFSMVRQSSTHRGPWVKYVPNMQQKTNWKHSLTNLNWQAIQVGERPGAYIFISTLAQSEETMNLKSMCLWSAVKVSEFVFPWKQPTQNMVH